MKLSHNDKKKLLKLKGQWGNNTIQWATNPADFNSVLTYFHAQQDVVSKQLDIQQPYLEKLHGKVEKMANKFSFKRAISGVGELQEFLQDWHEAMLDHTLQHILDYEFAKEPRIILLNVDKSTRQLERKKPRFFDRPFPKIASMQYTIKFSDQTTLQMTSLIEPAQVEKYRSAFNKKMSELASGHIASIWDQPERPVTRRLTI